MIGIILVVLFGFLLFDFFLFGIIPSRFGIWPSIKKANFGDVLIDETIYWAQSSFKGKLIENAVNKRMGYRSAVLTSKCIYLKNTNRTYLLCVYFDDVVSVSVENKIFGKIIKLNLRRDDYLEFKPKRPDFWIENIKENIGEGANNSCQ